MAGSLLQPVAAIAAAATAAARNLLPMVLLPSTAAILPHDGVLNTDES
jgi:hypothetical protein